MPRSVPWHRCEGELRLELYVPKTPKTRGKRAVMKRGSSHRLSRREPRAYARDAVFQRCFKARAQSHTDSCANAEKPADVKSAEDEKGAEDESEDDVFGLSPNLEST